MKQTQKSGGRTLPRMHTPPALRNGLGSSDLVLNGAQNVNSRAQRSKHFCRPHSIFLAQLVSKPANLCRLCNIKASLSAFRGTTPVVDTCNSPSSLTAPVATAVGLHISICFVFHDSPRQQTINSWRRSRSIPRPPPPSAPPLSQDDNCPPSLTCKASLSMAGRGSRKTAAADLNFLFLKRM